VFNKVYSADGWNRAWDARTVLKAQFFELERNAPWVSFLHIYLTAAAVFTISGVLMVPLVWRRLGWAYAAYTAIVLALPAATSANFLGMGRYVLAAFPCFALLAAALAGANRPTGARTRLRPALAAAWLAMSATGLAFMMSLYARWYLIS
jgi:hypothetical protein